MPTDIPTGHGLIPGRSSEIARKVLQAAADAGVDAYAVRTVDDGYIAPLAVLDAYEAATKKKEPEPSTKPAAKKSAASRKKE